MAWKLFERMVQNNHIIRGIDEDFDIGSHIPGMRIESGVLCGHCRINMETDDYRHFKCPLCEREFLQENS